MTTRQSSVMVALMSVVVVFVAVQSMIAAEPGPANERALPLMRTLAGNAELPLPFGIRGSYYWQKHGYDLDRLSVESPLLPMLGDLTRSLDPSTIDVENDVTQLGVQIDAWLLPFLNVYGLLGHVDGETEVNLGRNPAARQLGLQQLDVDYDGLVYGVGGTATYGVGNVFMAVNGVLTWTDLDGESSVRAWVLRPIIGLRLDRLSVWTGAMYEQTQEKHEGSIGIPNLGPVDYNLKLKEQEPWNWLVGAEYRINDQWFVSVEGGFGERRQFEGGLTYRF